jgi:hypothetical protein
MFFRFLLDAAVALVVGCHPEPALSGNGTPGPAPGRAPADAHRVVAPAPLVRGPGSARGGPRPPKKPPEKRPHDSTWSEIKSRVGGRP